MLRSAKYSFASFILLGIIATTSVFANPLAVSEASSLFSFAASSAAKKVNTRIKKISPGETQTFRISVESGQKAYVSIHSDKPVSMTVQTPGGEIKKSVAQSSHTRIFHRDGEYLIVVQSNEPTLYRLEVKVS